ncbi:MAG: hypothetical protein ABJ308_12610 [Halieaceae bacterium]
MKTIFYSTWLLLLILSGGAGTVWAQGSGDQLAAELINLRQQQRQLQRNAAQYQQSIELLRANGAAEGSPVLASLASQMEQTLVELKALNSREAELSSQLSGNGETTAPVAAPVALDPEAEEVAQLTRLLKDYYASEAAAEALQSSGVGGDNGAEAQAAAEIAASKVRLDGDESIVAIKKISERLADNSIPTQRRDVDIIYHIQVRRDGALVSSSSHSLKALGKSQYVGKVSLRGGDARVTVRKNSWKLELGQEAAADYLITLHLPNYGEPELHVIAVDELKATGWAELPPWLPYFGSLPPAQS